MSDPCINCGNPEAALYSFDLDLPNIRLCPVCSVTITLDPKRFDDMGSRRRKP
jgi:hypothetical protein